MNSKNKIIVLVIGLIIIGLGVYFYVKNKNFPNNGVEDKDVAIIGTSTTINIVGEPIIDLGSGNENVQPVDIKTLPKAPSLTRGVQYSSSVIPEMKVSIEANYKDTVLRIKKLPYDLEPWINLGIIYQSAGDYQGAKEAWEYASLLSPKNTTSFNNLGNLYHYYLKDFPRAEERFLKAIKNDPLYLLSYTNLFDLYRYSYLKETTKAVDILKQGIAKNPGNGNIDLVIALAQYYSEKGDKVNARTYYEQAILKAKALGNNPLVLSLEAEVKSLGK